MSEMLEAVTDDTFESKVLESKVPILVDYWAEWCPPCEKILPILESVAREFEGKVKVFKLNISQNTNIPQKYNVRGIPTLMIFKEGKSVATHVGGEDLTKLSLTTFIESNI